MRMAARLRRSGGLRPPSGGRRRHLTVLFTPICNPRQPHPPTLPPSRLPQWTGSPEGLRLVSTLRIGFQVQGNNSPATVKRYNDRYPRKVRKARPPAPHGARRVLAHRVPREEGGTTMYRPIPAGQGGSLSARATRCQPGRLAVPQANPSPSTPRAQAFGGNDPEGSAKLWQEHCLQEFSNLK